MSDGFNSAKHGAQPAGDNIFHSVQCLHSAAAETLWVFTTLEWKGMVSDECVAQVVSVLETGLARGDHSDVVICLEGSTR